MWLPLGIGVMSVCPGIPHWITPLSSHVSHGMSGVIRSHAAATEHLAKVTEDGFCSSQVKGGLSDWGRCGSWILRQLVIICPQPGSGEKCVLLLNLLPPFYSVWKLGVER